MTTAATLPDAASVIGAAVPRIDGPLKTTGAAQYAVDHNFPGLVHAVAVQSTIASGRIRILDASAAEQMPGVLLVLHHGNIGPLFRAVPGDDRQRQQQPCAWSTSLSRPTCAQASTTTPASANRLQNGAIRTQPLPPRRSKWMRRTLLRTSHTIPSNSTHR